MEVRDNNKNREAREALAAELPPVDPALIQALDERFPNRYPDMSWTDREIWIRAGQRSLVDFLIQHHEKQKED